MIRLLSFSVLLATAMMTASCDRSGSEKGTFVLIETDFGNMKVKLFDTTPKHRDNFVKLAKEGYYDGLLFHRVINQFMIQGGDPESRDAAPATALGNGGPGYTITAEPGAPHIKGAIAAARLGDQVNPQKNSSGSQFYIVHGQPQSDEGLNAIERQKGIKYSPEQRKLYKELGGTPFLDMDYTVFGEVVEGFDVLDKIAATPTSQFVQDRPNSDVKMKVRLLK